VEADKQAPDEFTAKADHVLTVNNNLRMLNGNDAAARGVSEKMGQKAKIDAIVTIPETEKVSLTFKKLTMQGAIAGLNRNTRSKRIQEEGFLCSQQWPE
jgi:hypothetical protein